jgi:hypothetical protein
MPIKVTGLDEIPARFIKDGANVIQVPVCFLVKIQQGVYTHSFLIF